MGKFKSIFLAFAALTLICCDPIGKTPPQFEVKEKTVLIYMVANNNLSSNAEDNIIDMKN